MTHCSACPSRSATGSSSAHRPTSSRRKAFAASAKTFPVFLHPRTGEEYALARTERKTAPGYTGFEFDAAPTVTLEDDLKRRDLTINAIARAEDGEIIDPWSGRADLAARVLRHVSPAFREDPLRVLRVARFAARFAPLGFTIAPETLELMKEIVAAGEMEALRPERVWQETVKALATERPDVYFETLRACGALAAHLSRGRRIVRRSATRAVASRDRYRRPHADGVADGGAVVAQRDRALRGARCTTLAKRRRRRNCSRATMATSNAPKSCSSGCARACPCRIGSAISRVLVARHHGTVHKAAELKPQTMLRMIMAADGLRQPERFDEMLLACEADARGRKGLEDRAYPQGDRLRAALRAAKGVDAAKVKAERGLDGEALGPSAARRAARRDQDRARGVSGRRSGTIGRRRRRRRRTPTARCRGSPRGRRGEPIGNSTAASIVSSFEPSIAERSVATRTFNEHLAELALDGDPALVVEEAVRERQRRRAEQVQARRCAAAR